MNPAGPPRATPTSNPDPRTLPDLNPLTDEVDEVEGSGASTDAMQGLAASVPTPSRFAEHRRLQLDLFPETLIEPGDDSPPSMGQPDSTPQMPTSWRGIEDWRDELNLAEFPVALLSDQNRDKQNILVFEDLIETRNGQTMTRRLTITGSHTHGLPTPADDEVLLGLIQLTRRRGQRVQRKVWFTRYELIDVLGWPHNGQSYRRIEESLQRWVGVTLTYANAWWDNTKKGWVNEMFHILDNVRLHDGERRGRTKGKKNRAQGEPWVIAGAKAREIQRSGEQAVVVEVDADAEPGPEPDSGYPMQELESMGGQGLSYFSWNEVVIRSFQSGNVKQLDMELYLKLRLPTAKRLYRFLDKRFYRVNRLEFDLEMFAYEHIGLSRKTGAAQIKRQLRPAMTELEELGFLEPADDSKRYRATRRGRWRIILIRQTADSPPASTAKPSAKPKPGTTGETAAPAPAPRGRPRGRASGDTQTQAASPAPAADQPRIASVRPKAPGVAPETPSAPGPGPAPVPGPVEVPPEGGASSSNLDSAAELIELTAALKSRGISARAAAELSAKYPVTRLRAQMAVFDWLLDRDDKRLSQNPAGYLRASIQDNYPPPRGAPGWVPDRSRGGRGAAPGSARTSAVSTSGSGAGSPAARPKPLFKTPREAAEDARLEWLRLGQERADRLKTHWDSLTEQERDEITDFAAAKFGMKGLLGRMKIFTEAQSLELMAEKLGLEPPIPLPDYDAIQRDAAEVARAVIAKARAEAEAARGEAAAQAKMPSNSDD